MASNTSIQLNFTGKGPLDAKMAPVAKYSDLAKITVTQRYPGMTVVVLNTDTTNIPTEYWLVGGVMNPNWKIKNGIVDTYTNLISIEPTACILGMEIIVQKDDNEQSPNFNGISTYYVSNIAYEYVYENADGEEITTNDLTKAQNEAIESDDYGDDDNFFDTNVVGVTWSLKNSSSSDLDAIQAQLSSITEGNATIAKQITDLETEINDLKEGQLIYVTEKQYVYKNASGDTQYTSDITTIPTDESGNTVNYDTLNYGIYVKNKDGYLDKLYVSVTGGDIEFEPVGPAEDDKEE